MAIGPNGTLALGAGAGVCAGAGRVFDKANAESAIAATAAYIRAREGRTAEIISLRKAESGGAVNRPIGSSNAVEPVRWGK